MPRATTGSTYPEAGGTVGIRWPEAGGRPQRGGFKNATEARRWFRANVAPRLDRGGPSSAILYAAFAELYVARWSPGKATRTVATMNVRLAPSLEQFGAWRLAELEPAVDDVVAWRATLPTEHARYRATRAMRQVLNGAVRWRYIATNPAHEFGANRQPRAREVDPFTVEEIDAIAEEIGPRYGPLVVFAAETGLRTNEWIALERRDVDRRAREVIVRHRVTDGEHYDDPKTDRHVVPLTPRAEAALDALPARLDTALVFPAPEGGYLDLDNWRSRHWAPAVEAAGLRRRGPYSLRHTFAAEALAKGMPTYDLCRLMATSLEMIERHYGHLVKGRTDAMRELLSGARGA